MGDDLARAGGESVRARQGGRGSSRARRGTPRSRRRWLDCHVRGTGGPDRDAVRKITVEALADVLGANWERIGNFTTGYGSYREDVASSYAFRLAGGPVIYGCVVDGWVDQLNITHATQETAAVLGRLGSTFRLILCDLWRDEVIDLANGSAVSAYAAANAAPDAD